MSIRIKINGLWGLMRAAEMAGINPKDFDFDAGGWILSCLRIQRGWGAVTDQVFPFDEKAIEEAINTDQFLLPSAVEVNAKSNRLDFYSRVWDPDDCRLALERRATVQASFYISEKWRNPPEGKIDFQQSERNHAHSVVFYSPRAHHPFPIRWKYSEALSFINSWGEKWGNCGWGAMTDEFFINEMYEAWSYESQISIPKLFGSGIQTVQWDAQLSQERVFLACDIIDVDTDNRIAWGLGTIRRGEIHIDDVFVKPEFRGRGFGREIITHFKKLSEEQQLPIRFWIPFSDVDTFEKREVVLGFMNENGLRIEKSPVDWAAGFAHPGQPIDLFPDFKLPPRATYVFADASPVTRGEHVNNIESSCSSTLSSSAFPFEELSLVRMAVDIPEEYVKIGDVGTIVHVYPNGKGFEVEFPSDDSPKVATVRPNQIQPA